LLFYLDLFYWEDEYGAPRVAVGFSREVTAEKGEFAGVNSHKLTDNKTLLVYVRRVIIVSTLSTAEFLKYIEETKSYSVLKQYRTGINLFSKFFGKTPDEILELRKQDVTSGNPVQKKRFSREIEKFHAWLLKPTHTIQGKKNRAYGINSARNYCVGIQQLFKFYEMAVVLPAQSKVGKSVISTKDFPLTVTALRKMYDVASLRERVVLSMAKDLAWRVSDFMTIRRDELPDLEQEPPIQLEKITKKENIIAKSFLSAETCELLKIYLPTLNQENPYLWQSNQRSHLEEKQLNRIIRSLVEKVKIKIPAGKRIRFHAFRKLFLSTCADLSVDVNLAKLMCGKAVDASMLAYLNGVQLKQAFEKYAHATRLLEKAEATAKEREDALVDMIEGQNKKIKALEVFLSARNKRPLTDIEHELNELKRENLELKVYIDLTLKEIKRILESHGLSTKDLGDLSETAEGGEITD